MVERHVERFGDAQGTGGQGRRGHGLGRERRRSALDLADERDGPGEGRLGEAGAIVVLVLVAGEIEPVPGGVPAPQVLVCAGESIQLRLPRVEERQVGGDRLIRGLGGERMENPPERCGIEPGRARERSHGDRGSERAQRGTPHRGPPAFGVCSNMDSSNFQPRLR